MFNYSEKNVNYINMTVELLTKVNGLEINEMDLVCIYGQIKQNMKDFGRMIKLMEKEHFIILMETFLKGIGLMIKRVGMVCILTLMEQNMKENEKMINKMAMELKFGLMDRNLKVII